MDTSVVIAVTHKADIHHEKSRKLLQSILKEPKPKIYVSEYVFDESISVALSKKWDISDELRVQFIKKIYDILYASRFFKVLHVDVLYSQAITYFNEHRDLLASFTDWTNVAAMQIRGIRKILSFDKHFDEIAKLKGFSYVQRIEQK